MRLLFNAAGLQYFNAGHILTLLMAPAIFLAMFFLLKNKSREFKYKALMIMFIINTVLFVSYKIFMYFTYDTFVVLNELPLHLCNFNIILLPLALKTKNRFLFSYLYYVGSIGALAAVVVFDTTFMGKGFSDYGVLIYFLYHSVLLASGILFPALKLYTPSLKDIFLAMGTLLGLAIIMYLINTIFRVTGACPIANYFYSYGMKGNPLLDMFWNLIPVPVIYLLPLLPIAGLVNCLMYFPFAKQHKEAVRIRCEQRENEVAEIKA